MDATARITVPELAQHWHSTPERILGQAMRLKFATFFSFEGLVFESQDDWRSHKGAASDRVRHRHLTLVRDVGERMLKHACRTNGHDKLTPRDTQRLGKIRRDVAQARTDLEELDLRCRARQAVREENLFRGDLKLLPATLHRLIQHGQVAHPITAFWHVGPVRYVTQADGQIALEGPLLFLEPPAGQHRFSKNVLNMDDILVERALVLNACQK